jgi:hypothetical protein
MGNDIFANQYTSKCASTAAGIIIHYHYSLSYYYFLAILRI